MLELTMRLRVLGSGSRGNSALLSADETLILLDAGLPIRELSARLESARIGHRGIDHVLVTHGHLDHSRSAGIIAKRHRATLHCAERYFQNRALSRAPEKRPLPDGGLVELEPRPGSDPGPVVRTARVPHDCDPTLALGIEHRGRHLSLVSDMGEPREDVASALRDPHLLLLEANHDVEMLRAGAYPQPLKDRVAGPRGHLSNDQMAVMLTRMVGPRTHTVVLIHLSEKNNTTDLALGAAKAALTRLDRPEIRVLTAAQHEPLDPIDV
ncbi:MAG: MBL fold metallo-hydrolase [Planctomycetota bacterium]|nr:MBL fold metallo-hydrolase [Planctomycetota bacterium]